MSKKFQRLNITRKKVRFFFRYRFGLYKKKKNRQRVSNAFRYYLRLNKIYRFILRNRQFLKELHGSMKDRELKLFHKYAYKKNTNREYSYVFLISLERRLCSILYQARLINKIKYLKQLVLHGKILINNSIKTSYSERVKSFDLIHFKYFKGSFYYLEKPLKKMIRRKTKLILKFCKLYRNIYLTKLYYRFKFSKNTINLRIFSIKNNYLNNLVYTIPFIKTNIIIKNPIKFLYLKYIWSFLFYKIKMFKNNRSVFRYLKNIFNNIDKFYELMLYFSYLKYLKKSMNIDNKNLVYNSLTKYESYSLNYLTIFNNFSLLIFKYFIVILLYYLYKLYLIRFYFMKQKYINNTYGIELLQNKITPAQNFLKNIVN